MGKLNGIKRNEGVGRKTKRYKMEQNYFEKIRNEIKRK